MSSSLVCSAATPCTCTQVSVVAHGLGSLQWYSELYLPRCGCGGGAVAGGELVAQAAVIRRFGGAGGYAPVISTKTLPPPPPPPESNPSGGAAGSTTGDAPLQLAVHLPQPLNTRIRRGLSRIGRGGPQIERGKRALT